MGGSASCTNKSDVHESQPRFTRTQRLSTLGSILLAADVSVVELVDFEDNFCVSKRSREDISQTWPLIRDAEPNFFNNIHYMILQKSPKMASLLKIKLDDGHLTNDKLERIGFGIRDMFFDMIVVNEFDRTLCSECCRTLGFVHSSYLAHGFKSCFIDVWTYSFEQNLQTLLSKTTKQPLIDARSEAGADPFDAAKMAWREMLQFVFEEMALGYEKY